MLTNGLNGTTEATATTATNSPYSPRGTTPIPATRLPPTKRTQTPNLPGIPIRPRSGGPLLTRADAEPAREIGEFFSRLLVGLFRPMGSSNDHGLHQQAVGGTLRNLLTTVAALLALNPTPSGVEHSV